MVLQHERNRSALAGLYIFFVMETIATCDVPLDAILAAPPAPIVAPLGAHVERMTSQQVFAHFAEALLHAALLRMDATVVVPYISCEPLAGEALPSARLEFDDTEAMLQCVDGLLAMVRNKVMGVAPPGTQRRAIVDRPRVVLMLPAGVPRSSIVGVQMAHCSVETPIDAAPARFQPRLAATDVMDEALHELAVMVVARCARPRGPCGAREARYTHGGSHGGTGMM